MFPAPHRPAMWLAKPVAVRLRVNRAVLLRVISATWLRVYHDVLSRVNHDIHRQARRLTQGWAEEWSAALRGRLQRSQTKQRRRFLLGHLEKSERGAMRSALPLLPGAYGGEADVEEIREDRLGNSEPISKCAYPILGEGSRSSHTEMIGP